ncbi:MAG: Fe-S cluster assembly ATPase SufC [Candidatus Pacebacteria bacterium RIFOXYB1_FULL_39_46]|nr:MAG: Fe-S cluster assembly ATPase SufC [Candidatus Pacebacteria bacterium RIFOXYA1_FULL_38_18]OGJ38179.1 MAG: Fe-S cluster assembly ATPase SufC [Candidatus Pacebacteria bacterium RIFOXYB1_FULL_39_46]OGJ39600.1 MAG: Fe-S cluster assembly ATPase SufC [Candidatus Pacebacteria bacterium RIFOXYC1_FULL_39_21]OGJ39931.1 MAG: Fe-S cluster assembly ATPase SufC [Candidatus Pacebacteria bacterium RIFOXYD1_FULL_39_27]
MAKTLQISKLKAQVAGETILRGIDLTVHPNEMVVIMGPNGSGKSTLAKVLAGHPEYEVKGSVKLNNQELLELSPDERAQAGLFLAFQYPVEIPGVKVLNFLWTVYTQQHPDRKKRQYASIVDFRNYLFGLASQLSISEKLLDRGLNEGFSGGEKKRLEILQMAVIKPRFAILDETDSGLDIDAIKVIARGVEQISQETGMGTIIITHYQRILQYLHYDKVHVVINGRIIKSGGPELVEELEQRGYGKIRD